MEKKALIAAILRGVLCAGYGICRIFPRRNEVLFLSRQSNEPSLDFRMLADEFAERGWTSCFKTKTLTKRTALSWALAIPGKLYHLARCRVCILDGGDPVVSLLEFACEGGDATRSGCEDGDATRPGCEGGDATCPGCEGGDATCPGCEGGDATRPGVFDRFPVEPVVVQLWHAFGAFKKIGYQTFGTREGRSPEMAKAFKLHRNYSYVLCSGSSCRETYAQAMNCPIERVVALGRPLMDVLVRERAQAEASSRTSRILFAPTLRKCADSSHPMRALYESGAWRKLEEYAQVDWSFHPVEAVEQATGNTDKLLRQADILVTDYSSVIFDAYLLGKKALFFVPDVEEYRESPGLGVDPSQVCPEICFESADALIGELCELAVGGKAYPQEAFEAFNQGAFDDLSGCATQHIVDFCIEKALR